jgi:hypothetical protein
MNDDPFAQNSGPKVLAAHEMEREQIDFQRGPDIFLEPGMYFVDVPPRPRRIDDSDVDIGNGSGIASRPGAEKHDTFGWPTGLDYGDDGLDYRIRQRDHERMIGASNQFVKGGRFQRAKSP